MELLVDINDLTLGEIEELEEITGKTVEDFGPGMKFSAKVALAFVYITQKRTNPEFTLDDARKVKVSEFSPAIPPTGEAAS